MAIPPILCLTGPSGIGKTHVLERVIPLLLRAGLRVAAVKHAGHVDLPDAGKDSDRLRRAGADPVVVASPEGCLAQGGGEASLPDLVFAFCQGADLVLAEGYGRSAFDKVLVLGRSGAAESPPRPLEAVRLRVGTGAGCELPGDDTEAVAAWILQWQQRRQRQREGLIAAVLIGGASRRMGQDKALLQLGGRSVLARLYELLTDRLGEAWIVGRRLPGEDLPRCARWHLDLQPGQGPLGGVATALTIAASAGPARGACVVACDMPAMGGELLDHLLGARNRGAPATVLVHPATHQVEPLGAVYEADSLGPIQEALASGQRSAVRLLESIPAHRVQVPPSLADQLANANTPEEWETFRKAHE